MASTAHGRLHPVCCNIIRLLKLLTVPRPGIMLIHYVDTLPAALCRPRLSPSVEVLAWLSYCSAGTSEHLCPLLKKYSEASFSSNSATWKLLLTLVLLQFLLGE